MNDTLRWLERVGRLVAENIREYVERRVQKWHNNECNRMHLLETPVQWRSSMDAPTLDAESPMFARMDRVEQNAALYGEMLDRIREREYDPIMDNRGAYEVLTELRDEAWREAVENIMGRAEVRTHDREGIHIQKVIYDPQTEFAWTISMHPGERIGKYVEKFPHELLRSAVEEPEFAERHLEEAVNDS